MTLSTPAERIVLGGHLSRKRRRILRPLALTAVLMSSARERRMGRKRGQWRAIAACWFELAIILHGIVLRLSILIVVVAYAA
jgi:hypothetical protein